MSKADDYYRSIRADRDAWKCEQEERCMCCQRSPHEHYVGEETPVWLEVHEIERRAHAQTSWGTRCNYLLLCNWCHPKMGGEEWPHARQLALKRKQDRDHYDLAEWLAIKPHPSSYVTEREVAMHGSGL